MEVGVDDRLVEAPEHAARELPERARRRQLDEVAVAPRRALAGRAVGVAELGDHGAHGVVRVPAAAAEERRLEARARAARRPPGGRARRDRRRSAARGSGSSSACGAPAARSASRARSSHGSSGLAGVRVRRPDQRGDREAARPLRLDAGEGLPRAVVQRSFDVARHHGVPFRLDVWHLRTRNAIRRARSAHGRRDARGDPPPRPRRGRDRGARTLRAREPAAPRARSRDRPPARRERIRRDRRRLQRRALQLPRAARVAAAATRCAARATRRCSRTSTRSTGSASSSTCTGCSRSRSGTGPGSGSCSRATGSARSRSCGRGCPTGRSPSPRS